MTPQISSTFRFACEAMNSRFEIVISEASSSPQLAASDIRAAAEEALEEIISVEGWLSAYRTDSALYKINAEAALYPTRADGRLFAFLHRALELSRMTDGLFDLTIAPLLKLWGMGHGIEGGRVPDEEEIQETLKCIGMADNVILNDEDITVAFARPGVRLDPGAIGKGYALDRAAEILREAGVRNALLHGGTSSVVALGAPPDSPEGWPLAVRHPHYPELIIERLFLYNQSLGVSAIHGKAFVGPDGITYGHVIDPRTGRPASSALLATVITVSATDADALSTAMLLDDSETLQIPERFPQVTRTFRY